MAHAAARRRRVRDLRRGGRPLPGRYRNNGGCSPVVRIGPRSGTLVRWFRFTSRERVETTRTCTCGATFTTRSTAKNGTIHAEVCSQCHPFYTGKQKILDTGGRVARFEKRFGKQASGSK